jgi:hypothetical protein
MPATLRVGLDQLAMAVDLYIESGGDVNEFDESEAAYPRWLGKDQVNYLVTRLPHRHVYLPVSPEAEGSSVPARFCQAAVWLCP